MPKDNKNKHGDYCEVFRELKTKSSVQIDLCENDKLRSALKRKIQKDFSQFKNRNFLDWDTCIRVKENKLTIYRLNFDE